MAANLDPDWLAHRYDEANDAFRFVRYSREERGAVPFLVDGHLPAREFRTISRAEARTVAGTAPLGFIFHSGFCCSTLLSSCLDQPGLASSFSEPMILNDAVGLRLRGADKGLLEAVLSDALDLLARPFESDEVSIVKPSTVVNGLADAMLAQRPAAKAVVMHAPLKDFLISIAKKGIDGRLWVRDLLLKCRAERRLEKFGFSDTDLLGQTDLQAAALGWLVQQDTFAQLIKRHPERVRSLASDDFLVDAMVTIGAAIDFFGLPQVKPEVERAIVQRLGRNSKDGSEYGREARDEDYRAGYAVHADEIDKVTIWAHHVADFAGVSQSLSQPLVS